MIINTRQENENREKVSRWGKTSLWNTLAGKREQQNEAQAEIIALERAAEAEAQEARSLGDKLTINRTALKVAKAQHEHVTQYLADLERIQSAAFCREDFYQVVERQSLIVAARDFLKNHAAYLAPVEKELKATEKRAKELGVI